METPCPVDYGKYDHPVFRERPVLIRLAQEHTEMCNLVAQSNVISWRVIETVSKLKLPRVYHVHYALRSIIGINQETHEPVYGDFHTLELRIPERYPIDPCTLYMITDAWHPNIKWDGPLKGRVCANSANFGRGYMLSQLVLRVGEILQYKNYLAEFIPPYPEEEKAAKWVLEYAEPQGIVNRMHGIAVDDAPLLGGKEKKPESSEEQQPSGTIIIKPKSQAGNSPRPKLIFGRDAPDPSTENT